MKQIPFLSLVLLATIAFIPATVLHAEDNSGSGDMYNKDSSAGAGQNNTPANAPPQTMSPAPQSPPPPSTGNQKDGSAPSSSGGSGSSTHSDDSDDKGSGGSYSGY